ncbi:hypothetical protein V2G26_000004 [Clonostachys chloroleuca]
MEDLYEVCGTPTVLRFLLKEGLVDGFGITVTGKDIKENIESLPDLSAGQEILQPVSKPIKPTDHLQILRGSLAAGGAVGKITGKEGTTFTAKTPSLSSATRAPRAGLGHDFALVTDGRFSGGSHGFVVGHVVPEAIERGPIGLVRDGDTITIDAEKNVMGVVDVSEAEMAERRKAWKAPPGRYSKRTLKKYAAVVSDASQGCITDRVIKT